MKLPTVSETLFSFKSFIGAMLALYLALSIGLPRPFWAMLTAYIVSQPFSGPVRSKAVYRVSGTILGSIATVLLVPLLATAPELQALALALWVGVCLFISLLDRTPRSYVFMLAGYTAALIAFPVVTSPGTVFDVAVARVEEITLGIVCGSLVHSLVFPQSLGPVLLQRMDHAIADARRWVSDALAAKNEAEGQRDRRKLAADITELRIMSTHLPFDTSHLRWTASAIGALQDRLAVMVPLLLGIEDRLHTLRKIDGLNLNQQASWRAILNDIAQWTEGKDSQPERAAQLRAAVDRIEPLIQRDATWSDLLKINLAVRLRTLIGAIEDCRNLRSQIDTGMHGKFSPEIQWQTGSSPRALHRDYGLAFLSALAAVVGILGCTAFWMLTAWPAGSGAAMMAAVFCSFFATQDDPVPGIKLFLRYTLASIPISAIYLLVILPAIDGFPMLVLSTAPVFLVLGIYIARPATSGKAMAMLFGVAGLLSMQDTGTADLVSFINSMLAQVIGIGAAALTTSLTRTVSAGWTARRLLRAGWTELARLGQAERAPLTASVSARMLDRVALLTPRLAMAGPQEDLVAADALNDLRVGLNMTQLLHIEPQLEESRVSVRLVLQTLSEHFRNRPALVESADPALLTGLDETLRAVCAAPSSQEQRQAAAALTGIRRDLFPHAPPYQSAATVSGELK